MAGQRIAAQLAHDGHPGLLDMIVGEYLRVKPSVLISVTTAVVECPVSACRFIVGSHSQASTALRTRHHSSNQGVQYCRPGDSDFNSSLSGHEYTAPFVLLVKSYSRSNLAVCGGSAHAYQARQQQRHLRPAPALWTPDSIGFEEPKTTLAM
ncbi:hypothetical protein BAUCODRAFT_30815, partial [Baudoinia panamericana UAMH 10762]